MTANSSENVLQRYLGLNEYEYFVIGEIGVNHNGDMGNVFKLIDLAQRSGLSAVKFQKRTPEICTPFHMREVNRETPWGQMSYFDYRKRIELSRENYFDIAEYCSSINMLWSASAWDIPSLEFLDSFDLPFHKVASAMNSNLDFLREVAVRNKFTIISTGMSTMEDVRRTVSVFQTEGCPFMLMHTTSTYPAADRILNLSAIKSLEDEFRVPVGYSGHESTTFPSQIAAVLGARVIERHITLDRAMWGTDQSASLSEQGLRELVTSLGRIPDLLGDGVKKVEEGEDVVAQRLRWWIS
jgi:N-acetylneuraminate synthase